MLVRLKSDRTGDIHLHEDLLAKLPTGALVEFDGHVQLRLVQHGGRWQRMRGEFLYTTEKESGSVAVKRALGPVSSSLPSANERDACPRETLVYISEPSLHGRILVTMYHQRVAIECWPPSSC